MEYKNIDKTKIETIKPTFPQIYAYTLPNRKEKDGWVKIGYTKRKNVEERIKEQTKTAAFTEEYNKLWAKPATFVKSKENFNDHRFHSYLEKFKLVEREPNTEWFYYNGTPYKSEHDFEDFINGKFDIETEKKTYILRKEQEEAVEKTLEYAKNHKNGEFLWNAKPRFGKTLSTYDFAIKFKSRRVLIVTNRPAIANSWYDDFKDFIYWKEDYEFISTSDTLKNRPVITKEEFNNRLISGGKSKFMAFISLQDLKGSRYFGGRFDKLEWVKELNFDLLVIDEAHEGVDTLKTDVAFNNIRRNFTLHLSGTPFKQITSGKFSENQIFNWTYSDEQLAKETFNESEIYNPYENLPKLNLFTYQMSQMIKDSINKGADIDGDNVDFAFDLNEFFSTNESGKFIYDKEIDKWLETLTKNEKYPFSTKDLRDKLKHTFWILNRVDSAKALYSKLKDHVVFENYEIILAAGDGKLSIDDQIENQKSYDRVKKAIVDNDKTITISVGQLTTGITIPEWTGVMILSDMKSPALYMQAAFRAQNPWEYNVNGKTYQKENAYVFDFAPSRSLLIYYDFANNLSRKTANGSGTTEEHKENVRELLNFFPVIAEDSLGKMVELDVNQVLTIPKTVKAKEVVKRGFMSNLLFQNVTNIFVSPLVQQILNKLNEVDNGKESQKKKEINTRNVTVDKEGKAVISNELLISTTNAHLGEKVYAKTSELINQSQNAKTDNLTSKTVESLKTSFYESVQNLTKEVSESNKQNDINRIANKAIDTVMKLVEKDFTLMDENKKIAIKEAKIEYEKSIEGLKDSFEKVKAKKEFEEKKEEIFVKHVAEVREYIEKNKEEIAQKTTKEVLQMVEEKKKNTVEDETRAKLRGFSRTIPSFLMAYGTKNVNLNNFDNIINNNVFEEVTGITLEDFRILRDEFNFFDQTVFDESVQEFLRKKVELANYFEDSQTEEIFDYIPPQKTNQIFTPKYVVKMMVDKLEEENPGIFSDSTKTFADLYIKSGLYITEIVKKLYKGLEKEIPNDKERIKHILENQVYGFAPTEIIYNIAKNFIFGFDDSAREIDTSHIVLLDTIPYAKGETEITLEEKCDELFGGKI